MSNDVAQSPQPYENEHQALERMPALLEPHGFSAVTAKRAHGMKFVDAKSADCSDVRFWLTQGWTDQRKYSAIQVGPVSEPGAAAFPDQHFIGFQEDRVASAKSKRATHALLNHMADGDILKAWRWRCRWRCVVKGTTVKEVLDTAHLPGNDWRTDN